MGKRYSQQFRQQLIDEYFAGGITLRALAKKHGVSKTFVWKLCRGEKLTRQSAERKAKRHLYVVGSVYDPNISGNLNRYKLEPLEIIEEKEPNFKYKGNKIVFNAEFTRAYLEYLKEISNN